MSPAGRFGGGAAATTGGLSMGSSLLLLSLLLLLLLLVSSLDGAESDCLSSEGGREEGSLGLLDPGRGGGGRGPLDDDDDDDDEEEEVEVEEEEESVVESSVAVTVGVEGDVCSRGEDDSICVVERTRPLSPAVVGDDDNDDERSSDETAGVSDAWRILSSTMTMRGLSFPLTIDGRLDLNDDGALLAPLLRPITLALPRLKCSSF